VITLDTNIWLSGLVFRGRPHRILEMAADGLLDVAVSEPVLIEVERILNRKFHWPLMHAKEAIETMDDNRILECAVASGSDVLVTHDKDLLSLGSCRGIKIQTAAEFLSAFEARGR